MLFLQFHLNLHHLVELQVFLLNEIIFFLFHLELYDKRTKFLENETKYDSLDGHIICYHKKTTNLLYITKIEKNSFSSI